MPSVIVSVLAVCSVLCSATAEEENRWILPKEPWKYIWYPPANWSLGFAPNGPTHCAIIGPELGEVSVGIHNIFDLHLNALEVAPEARLTFNTETTLTMHGEAHIRNDGLIEVYSATRRFLVGGPTLLLDGHGHLFLDSDEEFDIRRTGDGPRRFIHGADHLISGNGTISGVELENRGVIRADIEGTRLRFLFTHPPFPHFNTGLLEAAEGGTMEWRSGRLDNTGGRILAGAESEFVIRGHIVGGLISTEDSGVIRLHGGELTGTTLHGFSEVTADETVLSGVNTNHGTIRVGIDTQFDRALIIDDFSSILGSGEIVLDPEDDDSDVLWFGDDSVNGAGHTVRGGGVVGSYSMVNRGRILADHASIPLLLEYGPYVLDSSTGTIGAEKGGTLILDGQLDLEDGALCAADESEVVILNGAVRNGRLETDGSGVIRIREGTLENIKNAGLLNIMSHSNLDVRLAREFYNDGVVRFAHPEDDSTGLTCGSDPLVISGPGEFDLTEGSSSVAAFIDFDKTCTLIHESDHTIRGGGYLGSRGVFVNRGTIRAEDNDFGFLFRGDVFRNEGLIEATEGLQITFELCDVEGTGGTIRAADDSMILCDGAIIRDNTFETVGSGLVMSSSQVSEFIDITNRGLMRIVPFQPMRFRGVIRNDGEIEVTSTANFWAVMLTRGAESWLGGDGVVRMSGRARLSSTSEGELVVNGPDHSIRGEGRIGDNLATFINHGTIIAEGEEGLLIDSRGLGVNHGRLECINESTMTLRPPFDQRGTISIDDGSTLVVEAMDLVQSDGQMLVNGTLLLGEEDRAIALEGGELAGDGTIEGDVLSTGVIQPGDAIGMMTIDGDLVLGSDGSVVIQVDADGAAIDHDLLQVRGDAVIAGAIQFTFDGGVVPSPGSSIRVLACDGALSGAFDLPQGGITLTYEEHGVVAHFDGTAISFDPNGDGIVNGDDLMALFDSWGRCEGPCSADLNGDREVDVDDLLLLLDAVHSGE